MVGDRWNGGVQGLVFGVCGEGSGCGRCAVAREGRRFVVLRQGWVEFVSLCQITGTHIPASRNCGNRASVHLYRPITKGGGHKTQTHGSTISGWRSDSLSRKFDLEAEV